MLEILTLTLAPPVTTWCLAYWLAGAARGLARVAAIAACGLVAPLGVVAYALWTPETKPSPLSIDGPGYVMLGLLEWALLLTPICIGLSVLGALVRRRRLRPTP